MLNAAPTRPCAAYVNQSVHCPAHRVCACVHGISECSAQREECAGRSDAVCRAKPAEVASLCWTTLHSFRNAANPHCSATKPQRSPQRNCNETATKPHPTRTQSAPNPHPIRTQSAPKPQANRTLLEVLLEAWSAASPACPFLSCPASPQLRNQTATDRVCWVVSRRSPCRDLARTRRAARPGSASA